MISSRAAVFLLCLQFLGWKGTTASTTTPPAAPLPALLTGDCTVATATYASTSFYRDTRATVTNLVNGVDLPSIYSTSSADYTYYSYLTLGCQASKLDCCPSEALSVTSNTYLAAPSVVDYHVDFKVSALTACPADYATLTDTSSSTDSLGHLHTYSPSRICCPSSWGIWQTQFPALGTTRNCYQPWTEALLPQSTASQSTFPQKKRQAQQATKDYQEILSIPPFGGGAQYTLGVRITRSYNLVEPKGPKDKMKTGTIIGIAVPLGCLFIGTVLLYWVYKSREKRKKKRRAEKANEDAEKKPGMPELGEGLKHELEPGTTANIQEVRGVRAEGVREQHAAEERGAALQMPWSDAPLHELEARDLREMDTNVPAAHEAVADDWRIIP